MSKSQFDDALDINPVDDDRLGKVARPKKKQFAIIAGILAIGLLGGSTYLAIHKGWIFGQNKSASSTMASTAPQHTTFLTIPAVISSLDNGDSRPVYVKMATKLEIEGKESEASLKRFIPEIQDIFQTYLHETRPQEIRGNGIYRLRETLLRRLRVQVAPLKVTNFYITEFLIQ